jgi:hypothetical protein
MAFKEKVIGLILILLGAWPFVLKIEAVKNYFAAYTFLEILTPGEIVYQLAVIVLGVLLIWNVKTRMQQRQ